MARDFYSPVPPVPPVPLAVTKSVHQIDYIKQNLNSSNNNKQQQQQQQTT
jgi:hypothetical protein